MDFKKLFRNNDKAVSPVIGVILMVAITVILAAAIGSSVFSHGVSKSAPQANFDIKAGAFGAEDTSKIRVEHLGGEPVHFEDSSITKVVAVFDGTSYVIDAADNAGTDEVEGLGTMGVGDVKELTLKSTDSTKFPEMKSGDTVNIKVIDVQTNQMVCDKNIRFEGTATPEPEPEPEST